MHLNGSFDAPLYVSRISFVLFVFFFFFYGLLHARLFQLTIFLELMIHGRVVHHNGSLKDLLDTFMCMTLKLRCLRLNVN